MRKLALSACAALIVLGSAGVADAQYRGHRGGGWGYYPYAHRGAGWRGGALAAGLVGGVVLGGLAAATAPSYYPYTYGYGYPPPYYGAYPTSARLYRPYYAFPAAGYYRPGAVYSADPYAAHHEIRDGYRTVYRPGYGRVILGGPPY